MKKLFNKQNASFITLTLMLLMLTASLATAQTDSLAVWENIADGTLTSTWAETSNANWKGQNVSGVWTYNNTATAKLNWTYNASITGSRWMQTWEATCDDAEGGIGSAMFIDATHYYAVIYYLSFNGTDPAIYIIYYNAGTVSYWDTTPGSWTTNRSNATDYTNYEKDYQNGYVRFKALWNWNEAFDNCTVRFKAWETTGDEFPLWLCDTVITAVAPTTSTYPGLVVDKRWDLDAATTLFRRIWFWNLSYTMTPGLNHVIDCPTVSINTILTTYVDSEDPDLWNTTQLYKDMINLFDLTSFYEESFFMQPANQNDTIYVFSMMLTDMDDYWDMYFPAPPDELPDNVLIFHIYETIDGSNNDTDELLIRWDTDNDGDYEATDVAMWTNDTNTRFYNGWTENVDVLEYCVMSSGASTSGYAGEIFRDALYWDRVVLINWDNMYNGSSGQRIMDDECRMSMMFYDNNTDNIAVLQDFYPGDDDSHYVNTDGRNKSLNPTWYAENDSSFWTLFNADTTITGEPLSDPDDPYYESYPQVEINIVTIAIPVLLVVFLMMMVLSGAIATPQGIIAFLITLLLVFVTLMMIFT